MKHLLAITLLLVSGGLFAQSKSAEAFRAKYQDDRDAKVVSVSGNLFQLLANIANEVEEDEDAKALARIASEIRSMHILSVPLLKSGLELAEIKKLRSDIMNEKYEEFFTARDGKENIQVLAQGSKSEVRNMLVLIQSDDEFVLMNVDGVIDVKDLAVMARNHDKWD
jgi:hypothetical protein